MMVMMSVILASCMLIDDGYAREYRHRKMDKYPMNCKEASLVCADACKDCINDCKAVAALNDHCKSICDECIKACENCKKECENCFKNCTKETRKAVIRACKECKKACKKCSKTCEKNLEKYVDDENAERLHERCIESCNLCILACKDCIKACSGKKSGMAYSKRARAKTYSRGLGRNKYMCPKCNCPCEICPVNNNNGEEKENDD